jgi:tetratricopeptide (TPR) repeat protein
MFGRRKPPVRFPRYPRRWPWMLWWGFLLVVAVLVLLAIAYAVTRPAPRGGSLPFDELLSALRMKGPAIALTVATLLAIAFCFRQLWLDYMALRPGRIEVEPFTATSALRDVDVEKLRLDFRQRLARLHLNALAGAPGALGDGDFLDVLGRSGADARNWLGSAIAVLRAAKPSHAWQIRGVLVERETGPRYGLTVSVLRLPDKGNPPETLWGNTWDHAVRQGADYATAAILPRTKRCTRQWAAWRRFRMEGDLLGNYEDAVSYETERRYDEALETYYRAADHDPMNMALRLRIAQLQERMGLYLDALVTYMGMLKVGEGRARGQTLERRKARGERRRALVVARYRRLVLLGGSELAEQWLKVDASQAGSADAPELERAKRRQLLRDRVEAALVDELCEVAKRHPRVDPRKPVPLTARLRGRRPRRSSCAAEQVLAPEGCGALDDEPQDSRLFGLRELLALLALSEGDRVLRELRWHLGDRRLVLSRPTVKLTSRCIGIRLDWVQHNLERKQPDSWSPGSARLDKQLRWIEGIRGFNRWHEHYNSACLYALPLLAFESRSPGVPVLDREDSSELAQRAVSRLAVATASADSAYLAGRRDWVLSEDPDLDGLRAMSCFKVFEAMHFPSRDPTRFRPLHVKRLESSRYVLTLIEETARFWERTWHRRGKLLATHPDVHDLLQWWKDECQAWEDVPNVALNNRHWPARADLLGRLRCHADAEQVARPTVAFPRYADDPLTEKELGDDDEHRRTAADRIATLGEEHLHLVGRTVRQAQAKGRMRPTLGDIAEWQTELRKLDAQGREPRRFLLAILCDHHAALWQRMAEWVLAPMGDDREAVKERQTREKAFRDQIDRTDLVWCGAASWWKSPGLVRAAAHRGARPALFFGRWTSNNGVKRLPVA